MPSRTSSETIAETRPDYDRVGQATDGRTAATLLRELRDETTLLLRQEADLLKAESSEKMTRLSHNMMSVMAGGSVAFAGLLFLMAALTAGVYVLLAATELSHMTAGWLAPLIVGALVSIIGFAMIKKGVKEFRDESATPHRTVRTMQENKKWMKERARPNDQ
jgi:hypothetical protein